jgi:serine/threonine protein kinase
LTENRACKFNFNKPIYENADPLSIELLKSLLDVNPATRITAEMALRHPYFGNHPESRSLFDNSSMVDEKEEIYHNILRDNYCNFSSSSKRSPHPSFHTDLKSSNKENPSTPTTMHKKTSFGVSP